MGAERSFQISGTTTQDNIEPTNLKYVIPGDIIVKEGHITLVTNVIPDPDGTVTRRDQIRFIHAGEGRQSGYQVFANQTFGDGVGIGPIHLYSIKRLGTR